MSQPAAVIVLAAGQGTRMRSALPKVVHPIVGVSMIGHALRAAQGLNPDHLVTVVRHQRDLVAQEILRNSPESLIADQDEIPGTGRAVQCGLATLENEIGHVSGTIVVTYGDVPMLSTQTLQMLLDQHHAEGNAVTVLTSVVDDPTGYGRIIRDAHGSVIAIVEDRDTTPQQKAITEVNAGIYAFDAEFLTETLSGLGTDNDQGEVYLTDVLAAAAPAGRRAGAVVLTDPWQAQGCNDRVQLAQLGAEFNARICQEHMKAGVTIVDPSSTWIDVDVTIGADTTIWPGTTIRRGSVIGTGCEIGPAATIVSAQIGDNATIPTAWVENVAVTADTMVQPLSFLGRRDVD
ncbi:NTP transferase domain-containing protein [Schaalia sp. ZJ405]|uniref:bifunctional UDP-N-acetylglucosamine diphosphorylase/glucosamine-1-phosphate N-acetyltransferase GlmU n=1 Tax=unclassified Schaalia TaxID=2691889 RepID=UPI0013EBA4FC|nr:MULTISPECIES: sugar phosphate nucleotidyltransferase [unclassified Schaalia]QPK81662.1 NTP transferase domain-containing protein [Schaalia sp. ZJ405]